MVPLDVYGVVIGVPYYYTEDVIFVRKENQYSLVKDGQFFIINAHVVKSKIPLVSSIEEKIFIRSSRKFVFLFLK